jgi:hypothetical protein
MPTKTKPYTHLAERIFDASIQIEQIAWLAGHNSENLPGTLEELLEDYPEPICREIGYPWLDHDDDYPSAATLIDHCVDQRKQGFLVLWSWPVPSRIAEDGSSYAIYGQGRWLEVYYTDTFGDALIDRMEALQQERLHEVYQREHGKPFPANA